MTPAQSVIQSLSMDSKANTVAPLGAFKVGSIYSMRSVCDYNCIWSYEVVSRTAKRVKLAEIGKLHTEILTRGLSVYEGVEQCSPLGSYSMSPILGADKAKA